jgi:hypothetical protein
MTRGRGVKINPKGTTKAEQIIWMLDDGETPYPD